jgi:hypothetical protein
MHAFVHTWDPAMPLQVQAGFPALPALKPFSAITTLHAGLARR